MRESVESAAASLSMDDCVAAAGGIQVRGIPAKDWSAFFRLHKDSVQVHP